MLIIWNVEFETVTMFERLNLKPLIFSSSAPNSVNPSPITDQSKPVAEQLSNGDIKTSQSANTSPKLNQSENNNIKSSQSENGSPRSPANMIEGWLKRNYSTSAIRRSSSTSSSPLMPRRESSPVVEQVFNLFSEVKRDLETAMRQRDVFVLATDEEVSILQVMSSP